MFMQIIVLFHPRERKSSRSTAVKQVVRSSVERRGEWGGSAGPGSRRPPGRRDRSNSICSSEWPTTIWGITERCRQRRQGRKSHIKDLNLNNGEGLVRLQKPKPLSDLFPVKYLHKYFIKLCIYRSKKQNKNKSGYAANIQYMFILKCWKFTDLLKRD